MRPRFFAVVGVEPARRAVAKPSGSSSVSSASLVPHHVVRGRRARCSSSRASACRSRCRPLDHAHQDALHARARVGAHDPAAHVDGRWRPGRHVSRLFCVSNGTVAVVIGQSIANSIAGDTHDTLRATAIVALYFDLRIRDEAFDVQLLMQRNDARKPHRSGTNACERDAGRTGRSRRRAPRRAAHPLRPSLPRERRLPARCAVRCTGSATASRLGADRAIASTRFRSESGCSRPVAVIVGLVWFIVRARAAPRQPGRHDERADASRVRRRSRGSRRAGACCRRRRARRRPRAGGPPALPRRAAAARRSRRHRVPAVGHDRRGAPHARLAPLRRPRGNVRSGHLRRAAGGRARRRCRTTRVAARARRDGAPVSTDVADLQPRRRRRRPAPDLDRVAAWPSWSAVIVAGIVAFNLLAFGLDRAVGGSQPGGGDRLVVRDRSPRASPLSARSLAHYGHAVARSTRPIADATLPPNATVFVIEPTALTGDDDDALLQFVDEGGRLVDRRRGAVLPAQPQRRPADVAARGRHHVDRSRSRRSAPCARSTAAGTGSWSTTGAGHALVDTGGGAALLTDADRRAGRRSSSWPTRRRSRTRYLAHGRQRRVRARRSRATRADRSCSPKAYTATARAAGFAAIPDALEDRARARRAGRVRVRRGRAPAASGRPTATRARPSAGARRVRAGAVDQSRTYARSRRPRSGRRNAGRVRRIAHAVPGSAPNADDDAIAARGARVRVHRRRDRGAARAGHERRGRARLRPGCRARRRHDGRTQ